MTTNLESLPPLSEIDVTTTAFQTDLSRMGRFIAGEEDAADAFAVQKAHQHYETAENEAIWAQLHRAARILTTEVVFNEQVADELEVAWRATDEGIMVPYIWSPQAPELGINSTTPEYQARLSRIGTYVAESGLTRIFTVQARQLSIDTPPGMRALEVTDRPSRMQVISAVPRSSATANQASTWWFTPEEGTPIVLNYCEDAHESHNGGETNDERKEREKNENEEWK